MGQQNCSACCAKDRCLSREAELPRPLPGAAAAQDCAELKEPEPATPTAAAAFGLGRAPEPAAGLGREPPDAALLGHLTALTTCAADDTDQVLAPAPPEPELRGPEAERLRQLLAALGQDLEAVRGTLVPGEALSSCLLRFLRARRLKVKPAAAALRAHLKWYQRVQPGSLADRSLGEAAGCPAELLEQQLPTWHQGFDREGRPLVICRCGKLRLRPLLDAGVTVPRLLELGARACERGARLCGQQSRHCAREVPGSLVILDAEGWDAGSVWQSAARELAVGAVRLAQEHYPGRAWRLLIINVASDARFFLKVVSWKLPRRAWDQVTVYGCREQWLPELLRLVEEHELPPEYGGRGPSVREPAPVQLLQPRYSVSDAKPFEPTVLPQVAERVEGVLYQPAY